MLIAQAEYAEVRIEEYDDAFRDTPGICWRMLEYQALEVIHVITKIVITFKVDSNGRQIRVFTFKGIAKDANEAKE